jgi:hypothetical protein
MGASGELTLANSKITLLSASGTDRGNSAATVMLKGGMGGRLSVPRTCPFRKRTWDSPPPRQGVSTSHSGAAHVSFERMKTLGPCNV